ncbi:MAG: tetratricopeptide repeat protein, partial [Candidatus Adiutrix sp.]|nr:tetratricopeptide repeat protein [Candidatus Adiutrix sp.]
MTQNDNEYSAKAAGTDAAQAEGRDPRLVKAGELMNQGDIDGARKLWREMAEAEDTRAEGLHGLGLADLAAGNLDGALERLEEAAALKPESAAFLNNLAAAQMRGKLLYPAKNTLSRALELDRNYAEAWANLGFVMLSLGDDFGEIDLILNRALSLRPGHLGALEHLAELRRRQNRHQERAIILKALAEAKTPRTALFLRQAAESCLTFGDFAAAEPLLAQAVSVDANNADLARLHAEVLGALGRTAAAKDELRRGASLTSGQESWRWAHLGFAPRCFENAEGVDGYRQWLSDQLEEAAAE